MKEHDLTAVYGEPTKEFHNTLCRTLNSLPEAAPARSPRRRSWRTTAVALATAVVLCGAGVAAAGRMQSYVSHSSILESVNTVEAAQEKVAGIGVKTTLPEALGNYTFENATPVDGTGYDADGNAVESGRQLDVSYVAGGDRVSLYLGGPTESFGTDGYETQEYNGVTLYTHSYTMKTLPANYDLTDEDKAAEADGKQVFSFGGDGSVKTQQVQFVAWVQNGTMYNLLNMNEAPVLTMDDLVGMAEQVIDGGK